MANGYPVMLHLKDKQVVVVGGGAVAARKVRALLDSGARALLISPQATPALQDMANRGEIVWRRERYARDSFQADMPVLVIAATDNERVNRIVAQDAQRIRALCNVASGGSDQSDFSNMAQIEKPPLTIALSSEGKSPALLRLMKARLSESLDDEWATLADWLGDLREKGAAGASQSQRQRVYQRALASDVLSLLRDGHDEQARRQFDCIAQEGAAE